MSGTVCLCTQLDDANACKLRSNIHLIFIFHRLQPTESTDMLGDRVRVWSGWDLDSRPAVTNYVSENELRRETMTNPTGIQYSGVQSYHTSLTSHYRKLKTTCQGKMKTLARLEEQLLPRWGTRDRTAETSCYRYVWSGTQTFCAGWYRYHSLSLEAALH